MPELIAYLEMSATTTTRTLDKTASHIVHYGQASGTQLFHIQCTIGKQVDTAISHIVHYGQASGTQLFKQ